MVKTADQPAFAGKFTLGMNDDKMTIRHFRLPVPARRGWLSLRGR